MKKSLKKYISVVLATIMTATSVTFVNTTSVFADTSESTTATVVETGDCGDNVKYSLDSDGVLTISGSGNMKNFNHNTASYTSPFRNNSSIKKVIIENGVTSVGKESFEYCSGITSVEIPNSVTDIGESAFSMCTGITSIAIPDSVTSIGKSAFYQNSITSVEIPDGVTILEESVFMNCSKLKSVKMPKNLEYIMDYVFSGCSSLEDIEIPSSVGHIGDYSFSSCKSLTSITIPDGITILYTGIFQNCSNLTSVTIPSGVTYICNFTFQNCTSLAEITIPDTITTFAVGVFRGCTALKSITLPESVAYIGNDDFRDCTALESITILNIEANIGTDVFKNCNALKTVKCLQDSTAYKYTYPSNPEKVIIDEDTTESSTETTTETSTETTTETTTESTTETTTISGKCGDNITYSLDSDGVLTISGTGDMYDYQTYVTQSPFYENTAIKKIVIESGVTNIGADVFASCTSVTDIEIPSSVNSIEEFAISGCWALKNITIPSTVRAMGKYIFSGCNGLNIYCVQNSIADKYKYYPNGTVKIYLEPTTEITTETTTITGSCGDNATYSLDSDGVLTISGSGKTDDYEYMDLDKNYSPFRSNKFIHKIIIKNGITSIGAGLFQYCKNVYSIEIPNSVKSIGKFSFGGCSCLDSMTIPNSVETIDDYIFSGCGVLKVYCVQNSTADSYGQYPSGSEKIYISNVTGFESMDNGLVSDIDTDSPFADTVAGLDSTDKVFTLIGIITGNHTDTAFLNKISEVGFDIVNADDAEKIDTSAKSIRPEDLKDKDSSLNIINIKATEIYKNIYNTEHYDASKDSQKGYTGETKTTDDDNTSYFAELVAVCKGNRYYVYPYTKYTGSEYKVYETTVSGYELNNN